MCNRPLEEGGDSWNDANMEVEHLNTIDQYNPYDGWYGSPLDFELTLPESQPLTQASSSEGSAYSLSPYSPMMDSFNSPINSPIDDTIDPNLLEIPNPPGWYELDPVMYPPVFEMPHSPPRSAPPVPPTPGKKRADSSGVTCPYCSHKPKRRADLNRHISHVHKPASRLRHYRCDYRPCTRRDEPFSRRDHFRDHLRDYHKEDIEKRGVTVDDAWYWDRNTKPGWWRCSKCLIRVSVEEHGWECHSCGGMCCAKRQEVRMA